ncbi:MAG: penicillin-binding protein [Meiothermus sp.]|uniref:transglycosylase domain-containing protein n=1 Tax=Meiothermus sp. TaxID=1955249 RepID=UPI0025ED2902|nr:transglycosylase domain-containing protein [Meiothermus sp.]MCS7059028.1 penicillin-binding protein [Meiothermus sp.]MCS7194169.1 penicillin-binding protein [Meiothermus sp.]MCX7740633.1 penicillin-binding protein [Meiothermus sp.]MDW8090030.1 transglycosylase domain-containing protein [Meiothermus sp.]MDW8480679.1 transglycosylase domain-containing protein [Meiothermus sp.]
MRGLFRILKVVLAAALLGGLAGTAYVIWLLTRDLPSLEALDNLRFTATSTFYTRDGVPIADLASVEDGRAIARQLVRLSEVSPAVVVAVVVSEDQRFFRHYGVDPVRLLGGLYYTLRGDLQGGSTITTQVVKNTLLRELALERRGISGLERKLKEFPLALQVERRYSKEEILEMYLNVVPWGGNAQGIWAAAQAYFGKEPSELNLAEGAYLAVLIPAPNTRYLDYPSTRRRMRVLLNNMVAEGWISPEEAENAWRYKLVPKGWEVSYDEAGNLKSAALKDPSARVIPERNVRMAPYFVYEVQRYLKDKIGSDKLRNQGGLRVITTLDLRMQAAAEKAVSGRRLPDQAQLALVALEPNSGEVLAMVGARPGTEGEFNRATQAWRSPGSAIKPFTYGVALEAGWTQATTVLDAPIEYRTPQGVWRPKNFDGTYLNRPVSIRYAFDRSLNLPAIRTAEAIGVQRLGDKLRAAGFRLTGNMAVLANAIGGGAEITPIGLAAAYASFVNGGYWVEPRLVLRVEDSEGRIIYQPEGKKTLLWSPQVAYQIWDMLKGYVYDVPPGFRNSLAWQARIPGRVVGGKTGTSDQAIDLWFAGATRGLVAALWVGRDDHKPQRMGGVEPSSSLVNPPIWRDFVEEALRGRPAGDFPQPPGLVQASFDLLTGNPSASGVTAVFPASQAERLLSASPQSTPTAGPSSPTYTARPGSAVASGSTYQTIALDRDTGCLATPETPTDRLVWLQVSENQLSTYRCR